MSYRDRDEQERYSNEYESGMEVDGSFEKDSGNVFYKWSPNKLAARKRARLRMQTLIASVIAFFLALGLLLAPNEFGITIPKINFNLLDYKTLIFYVGFVVLTLVCSAVYYEFNFAKRRAPSFVDLDERASSRRLDFQIRKLKADIQQLKSSKDSDQLKRQEEVNISAPQAELYEFSAVESYIHGITRSLDRHIELSEKKASKLLDTGTMYLRRGIYFYVASIFVWQIVAHVWGVDKQLIFGIVSCSLTFLVVEFLAAWFLKQYRSFIDSSVQFMRVKSVFDRYLLSYYAVKEFSEEGATGLVESKAQILKVLAEEIKWPEALNSKSADMNHMVQMFDSLAGVFEKVKKASVKNDQVGA